MPPCERRAHRGHRVFHTVLRQHDHVHEALDHQRTLVLTDGLPGLEQPEQRPGLVEDRRLRRVQVLGAVLGLVAGLIAGVLARLATRLRAGLFLGFSPTEQASTKSNDPPAGVAHTKGDAIAKGVVAIDLGTTDLGTTDLRAIVR